MTKVQTTFQLSRALEERDFENISRMHSVYGMFTTRLQPTGDELFVEYDASRLSLKEVRGTLEQHGLPIR